MIGTIGELFPIREFHIFPLNLVYRWCAIDPAVKKFHDVVQCRIENRDIMNLSSFLDLVFILVGWHHWDFYNVDCSLKNEE